MTVVSTACVFAEEQADAASKNKILVMPVYNTAFEESDKFYGKNIELSYNLQSFFTFAIDVMSDYEVAKPNQDVLYNNYSLKSIYGYEGDSLSEIVDLDILQKAGKEYGVNLVMVSQVHSTWVLVEDLLYTLKAQVEFILVEIETGDIVYGEVIDGEDSFRYDSTKSKNKAGSIGDMSIGGNHLTIAELRQEPMKFGGMVTGFPFLDIARKLGEGLRM